jgi:hypothetical protein
MLYFTLHKEKSYVVYMFHTIKVVLTVSTKQ